ncbi:MAG TPA: ABC transporter permease [Verrucomicrobiae bacterium]|nr:ABC transporter permease [Verrucomicrobiae bacterium]
MPSSRPMAETQPGGDALVVKVGGSWHLTREDLPSASELMKDQEPGKEIRVIPENLTDWDSSLPLFLMQIRARAREHSARLNLDALPDALKALFHFIEESEKSPLQKNAREPEAHWLVLFGKRIRDKIKSSLEFVGLCAVGMAETPMDPRRVRWKDFYTEMVQAGPRAVPIVGLLSFLIGLVFAYETSAQLQRFGAQAFVINGLGVAVVREIGPILAAIVLAGRTGAAFAAHLGNMKLGGEIDALEVLGVSPVTFLVLPRLAALFFMMPMIALYADLLGILGGFVISVSMDGVTAAGFWVQLLAAVKLSNVLVGLVKAVVFGIVIGAAGTLRGLQCERTSAGVGLAATSAVVTGISAIIVADAIMAPIVHNLGF